MLEQVKQQNTRTNAQSETRLETEGNFLSRPVEWLRAEGCIGMEKTWRRIALWVITFFLAATIAGIPLLLLGVKEWRRQDKELESLVKNVSFEEAVKKGNLKAIRAHLNALGSDKERQEAVEKPDSSDFTPLFYAAESGSAEAINTLLDALGSYEARRDALFKYNKYSASRPLHFAASEGVYKNKGGVEAIHAVLAALKNPEDRKKALEQRDDPGRTALHYAANDEKRIEALLSWYTSHADKKTAVTMGTYDKITPLHWAARGQTIAPLNTLLNVLETQKEKKEAAQAANFDGVTPLHWAAESGSKEVFLLILNLFESLEEKVQALKMQNCMGHTVLDYAVKAGNVEVVTEIEAYLKQNTIN